MFRRGNKRRWRPLIAVVVAYALAAQSLLITVGGFTTLAQADSGAVTFVLCAHNSDGAPAQPADAPIYPACNHCIFCFAASHHAVVEAPTVAAARIELTVIDVAPANIAYASRRLSAYSIASPRGPPLKA